MNIKVNRKERLYFGIMAAISFMIYVSLFTGLFQPNIIVSRFFIFFVYLGIFFIFRLLMSVYLVGYIKGNSIKISENQFPDIFEILKKQSADLNLKQVPEMYVLQGNGVLNAFAMRFARKNFVVLYSSVFELAYEDGKDVVSFILGHELGHIKRKHVNFLKSIITLPAGFIPFLGSAYSRACEYTCDNIGFNLSPNGAVNGLLILAVGKKLYRKINILDFINDKDKKGFAFRFAEKFSTHPYLVKRISEVNKLNETPLDFNTSDFSFMTAKVENKEIQQ